MNDASGRSRRALVWFRSDLRVDDHPALAAAVAVAERGVVGLFVPTPQQWAEHGWGEAKRWFVLRSAAELGGRLAEAGIPLVVQPAARFDECPGLVSALARRLECDALFANREYEVNEAMRDRGVEDALRQAGVRVSWHHDQCLVAPGDLATAAGHPYVVFSAFRRAWERRLEAAPPVPEPAPRSRRSPAASSSGWEALDDLAPAVPASVAELWPAGEAAARRRLDTFLGSGLASYATHRDRPDLDGGSRLSPYLASGVLSTRRCLMGAVAANGGEISGGSRDVATWIGELAWRDFFRHVLVAFPRVGRGRAFRLAAEAVAWRRDEDELRAWSEGRTGVPFVDAGIRQLRATAWMHNRLRMVTAMFLSKDLLLDWRLGEAVFARHLIDLDFASNNGGWQWSASTGTDAAPYFRIFNPWSQGARFDPAGRYIRRWVPELGGVEPRDLHDPGRLARRIDGGLDYPRPLVSHGAARARALRAFEALRTRR